MGSGFVYSRRCSAQASRFRVEHLRFRALGVGIVWWLHMLVLQAS